MHQRRAGPLSLLARTRGAILDLVVEPPPSVLLAGARAFDGGHFFEAHELWEAHWLVEHDEGRRLLLQGLIQIAAAFHKLLDKDAPGPAASLFAKGLAKLDRAPAELDGHDLGAFREAVRAYAAAAASGRDLGNDRERWPRLGV